MLQYRRMKEDQMNPITVEGANNMRQTCKRVSWVVLLFSFICLENASAMTVVTRFIGGAAPANAVGGGNISDIVDAAARMWESVYADPITVTIYYGWGGIGTAGNHTLIEQGGRPNRETTGTILFDNSGSTLFYLDPTPYSNEEYKRRTEEYQDLGGGLINVARLYARPTGDAVGHIDLLSVALHEMGHAMGLCSDNRTFADQSSTGYINISANLSYAGTSAPLVVNRLGVVPHFNSIEIYYGNLMSGVNADERRMPSELDIVVNAQISGYTIHSLSPEQAPPSASNQTESTGSDRAAPIQKPSIRTYGSGRPLGAKLLRQ